MSAPGGKARCNTRPGELGMLVALGFLLSACASGPEPGEHHRAGYHVGQPSYKVGAPYQVKGEWYYPRVDYSYDETGMASWYGEAFDGQATANGEIYDLNQLTAAHKTLPLPSIVEVSNLRNGRSLRLRVNDRGPYANSRIIDVSRRAAQLLGFETAGTTPVRVRILRDESIEVAEAAMRGQTGRVQLAAGAIAIPAAAAAPPRPASPPPQMAAPPPAEPPPPQPRVALADASSAQQPPAQQSGTAQRHYFPSLISQAHAETAGSSGSAGTSNRIFVQAGAFAMPENAQRVRARIAAFGNVQVVSAEVHGAPLFRVRLGPVASASEADRLLSKVVGSGYPTARIVSE